MKISIWLSLTIFILQSGCSYIDDQLRFTQSSPDGKVTGYLMCSPASLVDPLVCHRLATAACTRLEQNLSSIQSVGSGGPRSYYHERMDIDLFYRVTHVVECAPTVR